MTSRERVLATLAQQRTDRVPIAEMWIDPAVVRAIVPDGRDANDLVEYLDLDVATIPTMVYQEKDVEWVDREKRLFRDKWGARQQLTEEALGVPAKPPVIETVHDLVAYAPPDPEQSPVVDQVRELRRRFPDKAIAVVGESGWAPAVGLRGGIENLFLDLALRPEFAKDLLAIGANYYSRLYPLALEAGADLVFLGDDYADKGGTMMSPEMFRDIILPHDDAVVKAVKKAGGACIKHTDGDIRKILDALVGTGLDGLGPLEDVPGMELAGILARYPGRLTVMGNISVDLLNRGSVEDVIAATRCLLRDVSATGAHIMSSGNTISSGVKPENYIAMVRTTQELGVYPITC